MARRVRYRRRADGVEDRAVDLDTLKSLFGPASDKFAESKTILAFGKHLDKIKARDRDRPRWGPGGEETGA